MPSGKYRRVCEYGHIYYKSSDCLTCPKCEEKKRPDSGFLSLISAPARRALMRINVATLHDLSGYGEKEITQLHGMGPKAIDILKSELITNGLSFKE